MSKTSKWYRTRPKPNLNNLNNRIEHITVTRTNILGSNYDRVTIRREQLCYSPNSSTRFARDAPEVIRANQVYARVAWVSTHIVLEHLAQTTLADPSLVEPTVLPKRGG